MIFYTTAAPAGTGIEGIMHICWVFLSFKKFPPRLFISPPPFTPLYRKGTRSAPGTSACWSPSTWWCGSRSTWSPNSTLESTFSWPPSSACDWPSREVRIFGLCVYRSEEDDYGLSLAYIGMYRFLINCFVTRITREVTVGSWWNWMHSCLKYFYGVTLLLLYYSCSYHQYCNCNSP